MLLSVWRLNCHECFVLCVLLFVWRLNCHECLRFVCVAVCLAAKLSRVFHFVCVAVCLHDAAVTKGLNSINGGSDDERKRRSDNRQRAGEEGTFYVNVEPEGKFLYTIKLYCSYCIVMEGR